MKLWKRRKKTQGGLDLIPHLHYPPKSKKGVTKQLSPVGMSVINARPIREIEWDLLMGHKFGDLK